VYSLNHVDQYPFGLNGPSDVHPFRRDAFGFGHDGDLMDGDDRRTCLFADGEGVSQMVSVVMGHNDQIRLCDGIGSAAGRRISGKKGIDVDGFGSLELDRGVP
jgi:hypothetical protein